MLRGSLPGARGAVRDRSLAELQDLDAGSWFAPEYAAARVPALAQVRGAQINAALAALDSPKVKGWRGLGLMVGIDLESPEAILAEAIDRDASDIHIDLEKLNVHVR